MSDNELNANQQSAVPTRQKYDLKWNIGKITTRLDTPTYIQFGHYMKEHNLLPSEALRKICNHYLSGYRSTKTYPNSSK